MAEVFGQYAFRLGGSSEREFRCSLQIITRPKHREGRAEAIEYPIRRGILLLFGEFQGAQVIRREIVWRGLKDGIEILVSNLELTLRYIDVGTAQMSQHILGIDL